MMTSSGVGPRGPWRTVLVGAFLLALILQGFVSFAVRPEPYPAIRMPSFGLAATAEGTYEVTFVSAIARFADGSTEKVTPSAIMEPFRFSTARPSWDYLFGPRSDLEPGASALAWLSDRVEELTGRRAAELAMCWRTADVSIVDAAVRDEKPCEWKRFEL